MVDLQPLGLQELPEDLLQLYKQKTSSWVQPARIISPHSQNLWEFGPIFSERVLYNYYDAQCEAEINVAVAVCIATLVGGGNPGFQAIASQNAVGFQELTYYNSLVLLR